MNALGRRPPFLSRKRSKQAWLRAYLSRKAAHRLAFPDSGPLRDPAPVLDCGAWTPGSTAKAPAVVPLLGTTVPGVDRPSFTESAAALGIENDAPIAKAIARARARGKTRPALLASEQQFMSIPTVSSNADHPIPRARFGELSVVPGLR